MPNSLQSSAIASPASRRATNCTLSSITEHSFQGITPSPLRGKVSPMCPVQCVTYVSGRSYFPSYVRMILRIYLRGGRLGRWRWRRWRRREFGVVHRHVLLQLFNLDPKAVAGPREGPTERHFHAICFAIIRIVNLRRIPAKRCFAVPDQAQQETRFFV